MEHDPPRRRGVPLELVITREGDDTGSDLGVETIRVWLDETGIHFRHAHGSRTEGHLPWSVALALSLLPPDVPRAGLIEAA